MDCHCAVDSHVMNATIEDQYQMVGQARKSRVVAGSAQKPSRNKEIEDDAVLSGTEASHAPNMAKRGIQVHYSESDEEADEDGLKNSQRSSDSAASAS